MENVLDPKFLGLTINLTQDKHGSRNGVRPKKLFFELIF
jgi:hypothetical protein